VRFNFPNQFLVYQHDTPNKYLFNKTVRAHSHGCMRVEHPDQYAETLFSISQPEEGYTAQCIRSLYGGGERNISLKSPIPVYLTYQTVFIDDSGRLQTRPDIYGLDKKIVNLLKRDSSSADVPIARKFTFETLLNESQEDLAFFDERIEKELVAKLQGIVSSEFVRMDYGEAISVLERAREKFEFPVKWGIDLQSEHERYLTEKHVKKPVIR
jgi:hypothetical protein